MRPLADIPMNERMRPADVDLFLDFEQYQKSTENENICMNYIFSVKSKKYNYIFMTLKF